MKITPADYSAIKRMTLVQLSRWIENLYRSAWKDGYDTALEEVYNENGAVQMVTAEWVEENCGSDILKKLLEGVEEDG